MTRSAHWPETNRYNSFSQQSSSKAPYTNDEPLPTSTALVPAPDSLISPSIAPSLHFYSNSSQKSSKVTEDDAELCPAKLKIIQTKAHEKQEQAGEISKKRTCRVIKKESTFLFIHLFTFEIFILLESDVNQAATCIQRMWRGYRTRVLNRQVQDVYQQIQSTRFTQYIK